MQRLAVIAKLRKGTAAEAAAIVRQGPPFDPGESGFDRHAVYLTPDHVVFLFEGDAADRSVEELVGDHLGSPAFRAWTPLLEDVPQIAREGYYWRRTG